MVGTGLVLVTTLTITHTYTHARTIHLLALGVSTILPKELKKILKPRLVRVPVLLEDHDHLSAADAKSHAKSVLGKAR